MLRPPAETLSAKDLAQSLQVFDVAARRGAFTTEEFVEIGTLYARIKAFVEASGGTAESLSFAPREATSVRALDSSSDGGGAVVSSMAR